MKYTAELADTYVEKKREYNETDELLIECLRKIDVKNKAVIDIGCGAGDHAKLIKRMGASRVVGIDIHERMIALAQGSQTEGSEIEFMVADGRNLPVESGSMDVVFTNFVIHYFPSATEVFQEMGRVLKSGGYVIATFNITDVDRGFEHLYNEPMPIRLGKDPDAIIVQNLIKSRTEIEEAIRKNNFELIEEYEMDHPKAVVDDSFPDEEHVHKHAVLFVLRKQS